VKLHGSEDVKSVALYLSVGVGNWTGNSNNSVFVAFAALVAGVAVLAKHGRRRSLGQA
jgi:hypothetical protein